MLDKVNTFGLKGVYSREHSVPSLVKSFASQIRVSQSVATSTTTTPRANAPTLVHMAVVVERTGGDFSSLIYTIVDQSTP